jgi:hypothetical protein
MDDEEAFYTPAGGIEDATAQNPSHTDVVEMLLEVARLPAMLMAVLIRSLGDVQGRNLQSVLEIDSLGLDGQHRTLHLLEVKSQYGMCPKDSSVLVACGSQSPSVCKCCTYTVTTPPLPPLSLCVSLCIWVQVCLPACMCVGCCYLIVCDPVHSVHTVEPKNCMF